MIFRWSMWGEQKQKNLELLKYSILTFRKQFSEIHDYIVFTDDVELLQIFLGDIAKVLDIHSEKENFYQIKSKATWMKWCPTAKLDVNQTEIYIDSDVFLLKFPEEINAFISNPKLKFAILDEFLGQPWQHGAMQRKATSNSPFVNAGLFIQKAGHSISDKLLRELDWWKKNIPECEQTHHDEQGALAIALTEYFINGELYILPKDKYMLIGPNENTNLENIDQVTLFHAVYPDHPAFYKHKSYLDQVINDMSSSPS